MYERERERERERGVYFSDVVNNLTQAGVRSGQQLKLTINNKK